MKLFKVLGCTLLVANLLFAQTTASYAQSEFFSMAVAQGDKAVKGHKIGAMVWGVTTIVCALACYGEWTGVSGKACEAVEVGADVIDIGQAIAIQQNMGALLVSGGTALVRSTAEKYIEEKATELITQQIAKYAANAEIQNNVGACVGAGWSAFKTGLHFYLLSEAKKSTKTNSTLGLQYHSNAPTMTPNQTPSTDRELAINNAAPAATPPQSGNASNEFPCQGEKNSGDGNAFLQCAVAQSGDFPKIANSDFLDAFKKGTGMDLGDFLKNTPDGLTAGQFIGAGLGAKGNAVADIAAAFGSLEKSAMALLTPEMGGTYAGGSATGSSGSGKKTNPFDAFGTDRGPAGAGDAVTESKFAKLSTMKSDLIPEDRSISLFDRISLRYHKNRENLTILPYSTPYNRSISGYNNL